MKIKQAFDGKSYYYEIIYTDGTIEECGDLRPEDFKLVEWLPETIERFKRMGEPLPQ